MTTAAGNEQLLNCYQLLSKELSDLRSQFVAGDVWHAQHGDFSDWAAQFGSCLDSAISLVQTGSYVEALSLLRSALEQWALDAIVLLGDRFVTYTPVETHEDFLEGVRRWEAGKIPFVVEAPELTKNQRKVRFVVRGLTSNENPELVIHPLYFAADRYDPFVGPPDQQDKIADWLDTASAKTFAESMMQMRGDFRWGALVESLQLNGIVEERHKIHLDVHYRFLSAFVHRFKTAHKDIERAPRHVCEELILLYANRLGSLYLRAFIGMTNKAPIVGLKDEFNRHELMTLSDELTSHLWLLTDEPDYFDRGQELGRRLVESRDFGVRQDPDALAIDEIRYYREPLTRLKTMHEDFAEGTTGFVHRTRWRA